MHIPLSADTLTNKSISSSIIAIDGDIMMMKYPHNHYNNGLVM